MLKPGTVFFLYLMENQGEIILYHDRFLIIDGTDVYHIGASLKDLGKKMFAFSKLEIPAASITALLQDRIDGAVQ